MDPFIAAEVKKTTKEIDQLLDLMNYYGPGPELSIPPSGKALNAYNKVAALRSLRPSIFWALGPANYSKVFQVVYGAGKKIQLSPRDESFLEFPQGRSA